MQGLRLGLRVRMRGLGFRMWGVGFRIRGEGLTFALGFRI